MLVNNNKTRTLNVSAKSASDTNWTSGQLQNESTANYTKKSTSTSQTLQMLFLKYMKSQRLQDFKPNLLLRYMNNSNTSYNNHPTWTKLEQSFNEQPIKANAWPSLGSLKQRTKNVLHETTQSTLSTSPPVSDIKYPKKKIIKQQTPLVTNLCTPSATQDSNKTYKKQRTIKIKEEEDSIIMGTVGNHVGDTEEEADLIFLREGATIRRRTTKTTTNHNSSFKKRPIHRTRRRHTSLQYSSRRYKARRKTTTLLSPMDTDDYPSMATFSSQRRLPNSIQLNTTTLEDQTTSTQSHRTTSGQRGGAEISSSRHHSDFTLSNFFTIQEPNKRRPILDCQKLNTYIQCHHFKMEGIPALREIMEKNDFICKLDLKDAYVVVGLHPQSRKYLTFMNQGIVYQYKTLAFGMSVSPRVFSKMMRFAVEQLRKEGIRLVYYLDDICLLAQTKEEMHKVCTRVITHLTSLGFILNQEKSILTPLHKQDFLGFTFNSTNMKITVPVKKISKLVSRIKQALQQPTHSCR